MSCATGECSNPGNCAVCSVPERFAHVPQYDPASRRALEGLKESAPALNGTKPRPNRDPRVIKRRRVGPNR